ncbi:hypothetical protein HK100_009160, partial [Physocladia obscura]
LVWLFPQWFLPLTSYAQSARTWSRRGAPPRPATCWPHSVAAPLLTTSALGPTPSTTSQGLTGNTCLLQSVSTFPIWKTVRLQVLQQQQQQHQHQQQQTQLQQLQQPAQTAQPDVSAIVSAVLTVVMPVFASRTAPEAASTLPPPPAPAPAPTVPRFPTHLQGKSVACVFTLVPAQIVHKILLLTFSFSNLHHLCMVVGEERQPGGLMLGNDGIFREADRKDMALTKIRLLMRLVCTLSRWWAIRCTGYKLTYSTGMPFALIAGWASYLDKICQWIGTGVPSAYQFGAVKEYSFAVLQPALDDLNFDFGQSQAQLRSSLIQGQIVKIP